MLPFLFRDVINVISPSLPFCFSFQPGFGCHDMFTSITWTKRLSYKIIILFKGEKNFKGPVYTLHIVKTFGKSEKNVVMCKSAFEILVLFDAVLQERFSGSD